jgi:hypothetical protein
LKQNLPDNLALQARIVLSFGAPAEDIQMRADCTGKRLFDTQIALRFGSEIGWVGICCARFLDATGVLGATRGPGATCVVDAMAAAPACDGFCVDVPAGETGGMAMRHPLWSF